MITHPEDKCQLKEQKMPRAQQCCSPGCQLAQGNTRVRSETILLTVYIRQGAKYALCMLLHQIRYETNINYFVILCDCHFIIIWMLFLPLNGLYLLPITDLLIPFISINFMILRCR